MLDLLLHLDRHLQAIITAWGVWTYPLLGLIVFCETGLILTPFLPGDSLLFAAGAFSATGALKLGVLIPLLSVAAIAGDAVNYAVGRALGGRLAREGRLRFVKPEHLARTHDFFERYGGKTIVIARFVPIVRTYAPFVAGAAGMTYARFTLFNVAGGLAWVLICTTAGYLFGNLPFVRRHFSLVVLGIVAVSLLPAVFEYWRYRRQRPG